MDEAARAAVLTSAGLLLCALLGAGPCWAAIALNPSARWKLLVWTSTALALVPGIAMAIWSMTLPPESIGWGFVLAGASLITGPWFVALLLGLLHLITRRQPGHIEE
jgi:hypothetical protein